MFDTLSETQKRIVFEKEGKFVVRACPGSGKTYSVAARLARKMAGWKLAHQGMATISFTNVAWQEIEKQITEHFKFKKPIPYPHFLGTIDSFINNFIFLPFGHLVMKCRSRPTLVGEPHGPWTGMSFSESLFDNISYDLNGNLYPLNQLRMPRNWKNNVYIKRAKIKLVRTGYATQDDANYFGMKILETYPTIAKALVYRFPMIMVDEAQDTSEIQMRILDILIENGLESIALVGDPDQAIFEWHDAKPQLFIRRFEEWTDNSIVLNENRRSSQIICDCTCRLSSLEEASIAINDDVKDCCIPPIITIYDIENIGNTVNGFINYCKKNGIIISPKDVAVVYRSKGLFNAITGIKKIQRNENPWEDDCPHSKDFAKGKYLYDNRDFRRGFKLIEKAIFKISQNTEYCSDSDLEILIEREGFLDFRKSIFELITMLPTTDCIIGEWIEKVNEVFAIHNIKLILKIKNKKGNLTFEQLFGIDNKQIVGKDFRLGTIHSIKGETFEAILVILKTRGIGKAYKTLLETNENISENEELRIIYVGITRPRKLVVLAVPDEDNKTVWENKLLHQT